MRKIIILLLFTQCTEEVLSFTVFSSFKNEFKYNQKYAMNMHTNFGKTHFILGYDNKKSAIKDDQKAHVQQSKIVKKNGSRKTKQEVAAQELLDDSRPIQSFFTSRHNVRSIIASVLKRAQKSILIAAFTLTDAGVATILQNAHNAGIKVEIITDYSNMSKPYSKIQDLAKGKVPVFYYNHALNRVNHKDARFTPLMHLKLIVCDDNIVITGSSNLTKAGQKENIETITVIRDQDSVREHIKEFDHLRPFCTTCHFHGE